MGAGLHSMFQALIKLMASGLCHTDVHACDGDWPGRPFLTLNHNRLCP